MRIRTVARIIASLTLALALAAPAAAQGTAGPGTGMTGGLLGVGVSFLRVPGGEDADSTTFNGFAVDFRKNIYAATSMDVGIVGDLGWHRHSEDFEGFDASATILTVMGGVRVTASQLDRVAPFGQFLVGMARGSAGGDICDIEEDLCESETEGAVGFGGGLDVRLTDRLNFRAQIDFLKILEENSDIATRFTIGISTLLGGR